MSRTDRPEPAPDHLDTNLGKLVPMADAPSMRPEARDQIRARLIARHARPQRGRSPVMIAGWGLALAAAGALVVANVRDRGDGNTVAGSTGGGGTGGTGGPKAPADQLVLADGSTADLGPAGKLTVLGDRHVRVTGQVLIDVVPGRGRFTVETDNGQLEVIGTRFLVDASAARTVASVLRGVVAMRSAGGEEVVRAGEQGSMTAKSRPVRGPAPRLSHLVSWVAERRRRDEVPAAVPARSGVLLARNPMWQEQEFPLPMRALTVDVHLENQVARVALDQTFHNPQPQQLEGVYKFSLPPDAAVSRLAMYVDGKLTESAVVERMRARRIYEDIVYTHRDPALLEQMGASKVSMRIFPLFGQQDKRVLLAYTQPLARTYDDLTVTVPLPDLETPVAEVDMRVKVVGCGKCEISSPSHQVDIERDGADAVVRHRGTAERLGDSLVLRVRQPDAPAVSVASTIDDARRYALVRVRPTLDAVQAQGTAVADRPHRWVLLSDTSASRGLVERRAQAELIDTLIQQIDEHDQVAVVAFDATHRRFGVWQDALDVDRKALAAFLTGDGGLGETDLVTSLEGAVKLLEGQPGYVVYVGDGTATGARRTIDQLRDAIAGKATFIGIGVGDGTDQPTLSALADATGGVAVHVDLGDDLAWRALDLVAALYTPRVTGLTATLESGGGANDALSADEVSAYLRSAQVAAGEDIEVVVRAPARADLRALVLNGSVGGRPWSQRVDLATAPRAPGDAGYLPRMWAERRVDHLMTLGDRATAPCPAAPAVCPSDAERAIAAYHTRKREIVELGKEHFLLSPHTSLIVLENDAMYAQYGVTKGSGVTWAPYAAPATIPTVTAAVAPPVVDPTPLWRMPTPWLGGAWGWDDDGISLRGRGMGGGGKNDGFIASGSGFGTIGLGKNGTIGHGSGTGSGYGVAGGRGGGGTGTATAATGAARPTTATPAPTMPAGGVVGDTAQPTSEPKAAAEPAPPPAADPWAMEKKDVKLGEFEEAPETEAAAKRELRDFAGADAPMEEGQVGFQLDLDAGESNRRDRAIDDAMTSGILGSSRLTRGPGRVGAFDELVIGNERWNLDGRGGNWHGHGYYWPGLQPTAFAHSGDWRLDDITEWLPGFSRTSFDELSEALEAAAAGGRGSISREARVAIDGARRKLGAGRWRFDGGGEVVVDGKGRLEATRTLEVGTGEVVTFDGNHLWHRYPSLGVETTREAADREPAVLAAFLPVMVPAADSLARWYHVTLSGTRTLRLTPVAKAGAVWELDLDDQGAVVAMRRVRGADAVTVLTAVRDLSGYVIEAGGVKTLVRFTADPSASIATPIAASVSITMPVLPVALAAAAPLANARGAGPSHRRLIHQLAASALAARDVGQLGRAAAVLADLGPLTAGELVLVGAGMAWVPGDKLDAILGPAPSGNATAAGIASEPIAQYLRASLAVRTGRRGAADFGAVAAPTTGVIALLADYRTLLLAIEQGNARNALAAFDRFASAHLGADTFRLIAAVRMAQQYAHASPDVVRALERVAEGPWRNLARQEAARYSYSRPADAAERWVALLSDVDLAAAPPVVDYQARQVVVSSARGEVGWQLAMSAWKQRVLAGGDYAHVMAYAAAAAMTPDSVDLDAALDRAAALAADADAVSAVVALASRTARTDRARAILDGARTRFPNDSGLLRLASAVAQQSGDLRAAADLFTRALRAEADRPIALSALRADYTRLISLHGQLARSAGGADRQLARDAAVAAGRDWRAIDPDHAARERLLGELLLSLGEDDEAWRYLSTPIDLAPREGSSFQSAAEVLERSNKLSHALTLWHRAYAIDATNPTWLQRAAQVELALGHKDAAKATLTRIARGSWHQRWSPVKEWADSALRAQR